MVSYKRRKYGKRRQYNLHLDETQVLNKSLKEVNNMESNLMIVSLFLFAILGSCSAASMGNIDWQPCRSEYLRRIAEGSSNDMLPRCDENGLYKPLQRTYSNFECYQPNGEPDSIYNYPGEGPCRQLKQCLRNHSLPGVDHKMIRCDKFGLFEPVQKDDGKMVCALPEGEFPEPYGLTAGKRDCIDSQPCSKVAQEHSETAQPGDVPVRCDKQGRFKPLQRFHEKLECFFPNGADFINDYVAQGPCRQLRKCLRHKYRMTKGVKEHKMIRCDRFGYFKTLQKSHDGMICVDFQGNIRKSTGVTGNQDCLYSVILH